MDPITIPDDIPLNSIKVLLDWYREKPVGKREALAAALTVLAYAGDQAVTGFFDPGDGMRAISMENELESIVAGEKAGIIPWELIARSIVDELLKQVFKK